MSSNKIKNQVINISSIADIGSERRVELTSDQLIDLATRLEIPSVQSATATLSIKKRGKKIQVEMELHAILNRTCVITLDPMEEIVKEFTNLDFIICDRPSEGVLEEEIDLSEDEPEPLYEPKLDLTELLMQQVSLAMSLYPRKENASAPVEIMTQKEESPFAILKKK